MKKNETKQFLKTYYTYHMKYGEEEKEKNPTIALLEKAQNMFLEIGDGYTAQEIQDIMERLQNKCVN